MKNIFMTLIIAIFLTGCYSPDLKIVNDKGTTIVGKVVKEELQYTFSIGNPAKDNTAVSETYNLSPVEFFDQTANLAMGPDYLNKKLGTDAIITITTSVKYTGDKGTAKLLINQTQSSFLAGTKFKEIRDSVENSQNEVMTLYKQKFSYLQ